MKNNLKILFYDIETSPNLSYVWGKWEQNVIDVKEHWGLLCYAYKWLGESKTHAKSLPDFKGSEEKLVKSLWDLFNEADIIIGHNSKSFDTKKSNALFLRHNLKPPMPYKQVDTKLVAKRYFRFDSNKLDDLGEFLNLGRKIDTGGFDLWLGCMNGNKKSWKKMIAYNKQDVVLLEKVYNKMLPYIDNHPNVALMQGERVACPNCGSKDVEKRGYRFTRVSKYQKWSCNNCGSWHSSPLTEDTQIR